MLTNSDLQTDVRYRGYRRLVVVVALIAGLLSACGSDSTPSSPTSPSPTPPPAANDFALTGDPESTQGATWTYRGTLQGVAYDLQGILLKPSGPGPFGAVIVSHGAGGSAANYSRGVGVEMRRWGLVVIATNYTHAGGVPMGAPGTLSDPGASQANVLRGHAVREILRTLGYVDQTRLAAHGHSMGAFVTTALVSAYPDDFRVASHTAGGVRVSSFDGASPTEAQARAVRTPYQLHHGDADVVVPIAMDQRFDSILQAGGVTREFHIYPGAAHNDVSQNGTVLARVRAWYATHGVP